MFVIRIISIISFLESHWSPFGLKKTLECALYINMFATSSTCTTNIYKRLQMLKFRLTTVQKPNGPKIRRLHLSKKKAIKNLNFWYFISNFLSEDRSSIIKAHLVLRFGLNTFDRLQSLSRITTMPTRKNGYRNRVFENLVTKSNSLTLK